jgi:hypothetical protein
MSLNPWQLFLIAIAGWMNREQGDVIDYLKEENRVLRELLGGKRPKLNDDQRATPGRQRQDAGPEAAGFLLLHCHPGDHSALAPKAHCQEV